MCGICGQLNYARSEPADRRLVETMTRTIVHRGPDDEGYFMDGAVGLGFRRLSIIDLSGGHQPMSDAAESVWVVFNGEIYNFLKLRAELEAKGCVFRTRSDTEVIVHGYKVWGLDVLHRLNGMFGFAIWDVQRRRLVLARDKAGIKLIYYQIDNGRLFFGSEIRPVLAAQTGQGELDATALQLFLRYRYTPAPLTLYKGIRKLPAGTAMIVENGQVQLKSYWEFQPKPFDPPPSEAEAEETLLGLYQKAVHRQLMSDVPLGLLLSGGLDSAMLLALMGREGGATKTFTVGYGADTDPDDEIEDAAQTARLLGASHATTRIDRTAFESILSKVTGILEEPVATASIVPMYFVCERARQDVKVALVGQGPDELFGGYKRHLGLQAGRLWRKLPRWSRSLLETGSGALRRNESWQRGLSSLDNPDRLGRFMDVFSLLPGPEVDGLFQDGLLPNDIDDKMLECWGDLGVKIKDLDELSAFNFLEIRSSLPDELLMYSDKISMHHGLELRVPYLDEEIIEYAIRLPDSYKVRCLSRKWLHKKVCGKFLPAEIIQRRKRGFASTIVDKWFQSSVGGRAADLLLDEQSLLFKFLRHDKVAGLYHAHKDGRSNHHKILFSLVFFEEWLRHRTICLP